MKSAENFFFYIFKRRTLKFEKTIRLRITANFFSFAYKVEIDLVQLCIQCAKRGVIFLFGKK